MQTRSQEECRPSHLSEIPALRCPERLPQRVARRRRRRHLPPTGGSACDWNGYEMCHPGRHTHLDPRLCDRIVRANHTDRVRHGLVLREAVADWKAHNPGVVRAIWCSRSALFHNPRWSGPFGARGARFITIRGDQGHLVGRQSTLLFSRPNVLLIRAGRRLRELTWSVKYLTVPWSV